MPSVFAWLDHSEEQRRRVLDVIDLFKEQGIADELGVGTIRDAIADILFPGTSNLMTRASYYLFVPWMYQRYERQKTPSSELAAKARREELRLIDRLLENGEKEGVIGRRAGAKLVRIPSSIYWSGLKRLGICLFDGSQDSYHRSVHRFYERQRMTVRTDDGERVGGGRENWHPRLPPAPDDWPAQADFRLTKSQAGFLRDQISLAAPESLLARLVRADDAPADVEYPWAHPYQSTFSDKIRWQLKHARNISEVMHGAALVYNLLLSELTGNDERGEEYRLKLQQWDRMLTNRMAALRDWDREDAWRFVASEGARVPRPTREFVDRWCDLAITPSPGAVADDQRARLLVTNREKRLKGPLARLENKRAQELWQGASSARRLRFRWSNAAIVIDDIVTALHGRDDA
jgi:hypothetical protein